MAMLVLPNEKVSDEYAGFFCQQAVEKAIKSVLSRRGMDYRKTHNIEELIERLDRAAIPFPAGLEECADLTPFAASLRYDYLPSDTADESPFDRAEAVRLTTLVVEWAEHIAKH